MAPAAPPSLDINSLNFDTCERLRHLDALLQRLGFAHRARVLDVGGYPGYMARAFPHWNVITVDTYANGHAPYIKGSGAALPFRDDAFDATIACDVLEHVPPQYRESFLHELARVTRGAVIVAGPYDTAGTAAAERLVRGLLPDSSPAQAWLAEHEDCGLPNLTATVQALEAAAALKVGVAAAGSLTNWILFFAGQAAGEQRHQAGEAFDRFVQSHNRLHGSGSSVSNDQLQGAGPAYRHAVIAAKDGATAARLAQVALVKPADAAAGDPRRQEIEEYVERLGDLLRIASERTGGKSEVGAGAVEDPAVCEYIERLERMLAHRTEAQPAQVAAPAGEPEAAGAGRLKRALRVLLGRE